MAAEDRAYDDRGTAKASAIWAFVTACEDVAGALVFEHDCATCSGAGCARCDGIGFVIPAEWARVLQAVIEAAVALCTDGVHTHGCTCGGDVLAGAELAPVAA